MYIDHKIIKASIGQAVYDVRNQGLSVHVHECFGHCVGERFETGSESRSENHCLHCFSLFSV